MIEGLRATTIFNSLIIFEKIDIFISSSLKSSSGASMTKLSILLLIQEMIDTWNLLDKQHAK